MPRPLRDLAPENYHLVTVRTEEARIWMVPQKKLNSTIGGIIARYQELFGIIIYTFCILGNHLHMVLKAQDQNMDEFMENVLREIARRVNWHNKRRGHFWSRRYDDQVIKREEDLLEAYLYVTTNAVKHGLVSKISYWPGLHCYDQIMCEGERSFPFVQRSKEDEKGNPSVSYHTLKLSVLPQHEGMQKDKRLSLIRELIREREQEIAKKRKENGEGFLGVKAIKSQPAGRVPLSVSYSPRPVCYTKDSQTRREYRAQRRLFKERYAEASESFRGGKLDTEFPPHCFKPPLHRKPKSRAQRAAAAA